MRLSRKGGIHDVQYIPKEKTDDDGRSIDNGDIRRGVRGFCACDADNRIC